VVASALLSREVLAIVCQRNLLLLFFLFLNVHLILLVQGRPLLRLLFVRAVQMFLHRRAAALLAEA